MRLIDFAPSPFFRWHIFLGRKVTVAARDSIKIDKVKATYICDGLLPDDFQINKALEELNHQYGNGEWYELRRCKEWRWPWQSSQKVTKFGAGGTVLLLGGTYEIRTGIRLANMPLPIEEQLKELGIVSEDI